MISLLLICTIILVVYFLVKPKKKKFSANKNQSFSNSLRTNVPGNVSGSNKPIENKAPPPKNTQNSRPADSRRTSERNDVGSKAAKAPTNKQSEKVIIEQLQQVLNNTANATKMEIESNLQANSQSSHPVEIKSEDIIDIAATSYNLNTGYEPSNAINVPDWTHHYVYSYDEINAASQAQKDFYKVFKAEFEMGNCLNLKGSLNYAFILLFDLFREYEQHKDISFLERQLNILAKEFPKTQRYAQSFFNKLKYPTVVTSPVENYSYQSNYNDEYWKLGSRFKSKLNLTETEVAFLNKIWNQTNNFCSIEFCYLEVIKLFLLSVRKLEKEYKAANTSLDAVIEKIADIVARKQFRYRNGSDNYRYCIQSTSGQIWAHLFRVCENLVRETYGHKRKLNIEIVFTTATEAQETFRNEIFSRFVAISSSLIPAIQEPDEATETELNAQNPTRWKIAFEGISSNLGKQPEKFLEAVLHLGNQNSKNPSVENIFFEASKFMAKENKQTALRLYVHYIDYDLRSDVFDNKQHAKTIQKSLFANEQQISDFTALISTFVKDRNLQAALDTVPFIYAVKRKKIELNRNAIQDVNNRHADTVFLLNEILSDEEEVMNTVAASEKEANLVDMAELILEIPSDNDKSGLSIFSGELNLTDIQEQSLNYFVKSNYSISQSDFEEFAKTNGAFKNQLIESINERCYEILDDILIEEEDDFYTLNHSYYQQLLA